MYLYSIRDYRTNSYKIGYSCDPNRRVKELSRQPTLLPQEHKFRLMFAYPARPQVETGIHLFLKRFRVRGEWFRFCGCVTASITIALEKHADPLGYLYHDGIHRRQCIAGIYCETLDKTGHYVDFPDDDRRPILEL